jgi:hypothetical protein
MNRNNKATKATNERNMIAGLTKYVGEATMVIGGKSYTGTKLAEIMQSRLDVDEAVIAAKAVWQNAVQRERAQNAATQKVAADVRKAVYIMFGSSVETLAEFGLAPHKRGTLTPEQQVERTAKVRATRAARHTMGPKQRQQIKGEAPATAAPPAIEPPAPRPTPSTLNGAPQSPS